MGGGGSGSGGGCFWKGISELGWELLGQQMTLERNCANQGLDKFHCLRAILFIYIRADASSPTVFSPMHQ